MTAVQDWLKSVMINPLRVRVLDSAENKPDRDDLPLLQPGLERC